MAMNPRLLRPRASGFNPKSIAGLQLWLDAADSSTISTGTGVSEWRDKSPTGSNWTQATANNQPATGTQSMNGKNVLVFDGSNDALSAVEPLSTSLPMTMFIVQRIVAKSDFGMTYAMTGYNYIGQSGTTGRVLWSFGGGTFAEGPTDVSGTDAIAACVLPASGSGEAFMNGVRIAGNSNKPDLTGTHYLGRFQFGNNGNVRIAEVLSYSVALSSLDRQKVEGYLAWKWGLQSQLPSNHPYAYSFPGFGSQARPSNADALAWESAVYSNSGSTSVGTLAAVNTFCAAIDTAGIRDRFYRLNLFAGTGLNAALVPLYRGPSRTGTQYGNTTDTNNGPFVSGDYVETGASGGLTGASGKNLSTGVQPLASGSPIAAFGFNALLSITRPAGRATVIGVTDTNAFARIQLNEAAQVWGGWNRGSTIENVNGGVGTSPALFVLGRRTGNVDYLNVNGVDVTTVASTAADNTTAVATLFNSQTLRAGAYAIGGDVTGSQLLSFYNALRTFQNALSRNV